MTNYYKKRDARAKLGKVLELNGWEIFGYKNDESDSMTDYYSPADWDGIATKNGYVLVIDNKYFSNSGKVVTKTINNNKTNNYDKIQKLSKMTIENGCTESEAAAAQNQIKKLQEKENKNITTQVLYQYPEYQINPKGCIWHLEKDNEIICKGRSLTVFAELPEVYEFDYETETFKSGYDFWYSWEGCERVKEKRILKESELKALAEFKKLLSKLNSYTSIKLGEEVEDEKLIKKVTYKTVTKIDKQEIQRESELKVNDVVWCNGYCKVLKVESDLNIYRVVKISGKTFKESKAMDAHFNLNKRSFDNSLNRGTLKVYNIVEVEEQKEIVKWVKSTKKQTKKTATNTDENLNTEVENNVNDVKVVLNDDKNGVELYFNSKPSEEVRNNLKANGFRWSKYNKCWYAKQSEDTLNFARSFNTLDDEELKQNSKEYLESKEKELQIKIDEININDIENYFVPDEISKRENENSFFRSTETNHTKVLQNILLEANNEVLEVLQCTNNINTKYRLLTALQSFKTNYTNAYIDYLRFKGSNPSWMLTGRSGRNISRDNKKNNIQNNKLFKLSEIKEKYNKILNKCKSTIKKEIKLNQEKEINNISVLPKFNRIKIEMDPYNLNIFSGSNKQLKQVSEYQGYYIFKNWGCYRVYNNQGNEIFSTKTTDNLDIAKKWLVNYLNKN